LFAGTDAEAGELEKATMLAVSARLTPANRVLAR
jgi:hypothetical protein